MKDVVKYLSDNPIQYLATVGLDGKPRNRPFQFMLEHNGKLYFCTGNQKDVYAQLQANPFIEITVSAPDFSWLRLSGKAVFDGSQVIKSQIIEANPLVKSIYQAADNPVFEIFYIDQATAVIADFSGNPPRVYNM
jgi:uncharacterized pyridoxamine 5'-phosphate oxidase family protein